jgi:hypothetical protein
MANAPQADNADTVAYLNQFIAQCGPVVAIDSDAPDSNRSYFIATANYQAGATAGNKLAEALLGSGSPSGWSPRIPWAEAPRRSRMQTSRPLRRSRTRVSRRTSYHPPTTQGPSQTSRCKRRPCPPSKPTLSTC